VFLQSCGQNMNNRGADLVYIESIIKLGLTYSKWYINSGIYNER